MAPLTAPAKQGFDYFIGQVDQNLCHNMYPRKIDVGNGTRNLNLSLTITEGLTAPPDATLTWLYRDRLQGLHDANWRRARAHP